MNSVNTKVNKHTSVSYQEMILSVIASVLCTLGCVLLLYCVFPSISGTAALYVVLSLILPALFSILLWFGKGRWLAPSVSIAVLVIFIIRFRAIRNAMFVFANDILEFLTGKTGRIHLYFETDGSSGTLLLPILYLILISLLSAIMIRKKRIAFPLILLGISAAAVVYGFPVSVIAPLISAAAAVISVAACRRDYSVNKAPASGVLSMLLPFLITLVSVALIFALVTVIKGSDASGNNTIVKSLNHKIHTVRYEPSGSTGMPEGNLSSFTSNVESDKPMLKITMTSPGKLYLRGFTGEVYEDSEWKNVSAETYIDNAPLFYTLHENGFYGQSMIATAAKALSGDAAYGSLSITNEGACRKYTYIPYGLYDSSILDAAMIGDTGCISSGSRSGKSGTSGSSGRTGSRNYTLYTVPGSLPEWYETEIALASNYDDPGVSEYLKAEGSYYEYVLENDLQLSDDAAETCVELFGEAPVGRTLSDILELVKRTLNEENFMEQKDATSVHYASSAALMLRYLGVPARYVEGYYLTPEEAASYAPGDEIVLTGKNAHAWAEFYIRGIGWIPFETVPGYVDNDELSRVTTLIERSKETLGSSPLYSQMEVIYTSGIHKQEKPEIRSPRIDFEWKNVYFLYIIITAAVILLAMLSVILIKQQLRFRNSISKIQRAKEEKDNNNAIAMEFGYAVRLLDTAGIEHPSENENKRMQHINELARFSGRRLPDNCLSEAEKFRAEAADACLKAWSLKDRIRYRFINKIV